MPRGIFDATVVSNTTLCREHYRLTLRIPDFPASRPGQFVQLACRPADAGEVDHLIEWQDGERPSIEGREFQTHDAFLRRPFSIAGRREVAGGAEIDLIGREVGPGTRFLSTLNVGDVISVVGPLGNAFELPPAGGLALLVGGGVGIPPMIYLAQVLAETGGRRAVAFAGALTSDLLALTPCREDPTSGFFTAIEEFRPFNVPVAITTDDGTAGLRGFVTDALTIYLDATPIDVSKTILYTCGPEPMMKAIQAIGAARSIRAQIAVERAMACGMGTCQSCVIKVLKTDPDAPPLAGRESCYRLACTDGPVFDGAALLW